VQVGPSWFAKCILYGLAQSAIFASVKSAVCKPRGIAPCEPPGYVSGNATQSGVDNLPQANRVQGQLLIARSR
jgi:hypothetical protein